MSASADYDALPHQSALWVSKKRHLAMLGGVGCGKTDFQAIWAIKKLKEAQTWPQDKAQGIIAANTYPQLLDSTLRNVYGNWRRFGLYFEPRELPRAYSPFTLRVWINESWREILCRSLNHPDTIRGTEVGWAEIDEAFGTTRDAADIVNSRVRETSQPINQILYTSTPDDPTTSWLYDLFVDGYNPDVMEVVTATSYDNPHLPVGFVDELKATYSVKKFDREVLAKWISLESGLIYYAFDRTIHVDEAAEFDPNLPVHWTCDFNIGVDKPMSSALCQIKKGRDPAGRVRPERHTFDEIIIDSADTHDAVDEFESRYAGKIPHENVIICGDASGRARDTRSKTSDYGIFRSRGYINQNVPRANPAIRTRHNVMNGLLRSASGDVRDRYHPRCKTCIKGLETVRLRGGAQYLELETREQHVTTALGYHACQEFPDRAPVTSVRPLIRTA